MKTYFTLLLLVASFEIANAQKMPSFPYEEMDQQATAFFKSYRDLNADSLASLYADSMMFIDETYAGLGGKIAQITGKENLRNHYKQKTFAHAIKFDYQEENRFFSGEQGIFRGVL
ncbi:MAG: hypothetical protein AAFQ94_23525, partial [Bacteroidota bacterium]